MVMLFYGSVVLMKTTLTKNMQSSRLWNTLNAVKNNHVYRLDAGAWLSGMGIQSRNHMLDDVTRIFSK